MAVSRPPRSPPEERRRGPVEWSEVSMADGGEQRLREADSRPSSVSASTASGSPPSSEAGINAEVPCRNTRLAGCRPVIFSAGARGGGPWVASERTA